MEAHGNSKPVECDDMGTEEPEAEGVEGPELGSREQSKRIKSHARK